MGISIASAFALYVFIYFMKNRVYAGPRDFLAVGEHAQKGKTPTMGGFVFIFPVIALLFFHSHDPKAVFIALATLSSMLVGAYDDYEKIKKKSGISATSKFLLQATGAFIASVFWYLTDSTIVSTLNMGAFTLPLGIFYTIWTTFVIMSTSHAVNLTDGLDGLACSQVCITLTGYAFVALSCFAFPSACLYALYLIAATLGFYAYNRYPALIFMGDIGALGLGSYIAALFLILHAEWLLLIMGAAFVIETLSVIWQYIWWKRFKQRFFLIAPLHHHFEKKGWHEKKIVKIAALFSALLTLTASAFMYTYYL